MTTFVAVAEALRAYHLMPACRSTPEFRTAAALLGLEPDLIIPPKAPSARQGYREIALAILADPWCDMVFAPDALAALESAAERSRSLALAARLAVLELAAIWEQARPEAKASAHDRAA